MYHPRIHLALLAAGILPAVTSLNTFGDATSGTLYYTTFSGAPNIHKVDFSYDGLNTFSLATPVDIASTAGADGIVFNPNNGNLLIGGQGNRVHELTVGGTPVATVSPNTSAFHLSVDPSKKTLWAAGIPAGLAEIPLTPSINTGIAYQMLGDDRAVDTLAWRGSTVLYTSSDSNGGEHYGTIALDMTLKTATTTRVGSMPATHGATYDPFTDDFILIGDNHITQIDGVTLLPISDLVVPGVNFDQGTVDGNGHGYFADNNGKLVFLDYSASGVVNDAGNFLASPFLANFLDDVAPLIGPGGPRVPDSGVGLGGLLLTFAGLVLYRRRSQPAA